MSRDRIREAFDKASAIAEQEFYAEVLRILNTRRNLAKFVSGMGIVFFVHADGSHISLEDRSYLSRLRKMLDDWDGTFHFSGNPLNITRDMELSDILEVEA